MSCVQNNYIRAVSKHITGKGKRDVIYHMLHNHELFYGIEPQRLLLHNLICPQYAARMKSIGMKAVNLVELLFGFLFVNTGVFINFVTASRKKIGLRDFKICTKTSRKKASA